MRKSKKYTRLDLIKTIGKRQYLILEKDHSELIQQIESHPLTKGILNVGQYFIIIGEVKSWKLIYLSEDSEKMTGYTFQEASDLGAELMVRLTHPDDFPILMSNNQKAIEFLYSIPLKERIFQTSTHYYRAVRKDGSTFNVQHQSFPIGFDAIGNPYIFANIYTDISHLKIPQIPKTFILNRKTNELTEISSSETLIEGVVLKISKREKEVLQFLTKGYSSKIIAEKMGISFHTVVTYRKRLLEKTGVKNTSELVNFALVHSLL